MNYKRKVYPIKMNDQRVITIVKLLDMWKKEKDDFVHLWNENKNIGSCYLIDARELIENDLVDEVINKIYDLVFTQINDIRKARLMIEKEKFM